MLNIAVLLNPIVDADTSNQDSEQSEDFDSWCPMTAVPFTVSTKLQTRALSQRKAYNLDLGKRTSCMQQMDALETPMLSVKDCKYCHVPFQHCC